MLCQIKKSSSETNMNNYAPDFMNKGPIDQLQRHLIYLTCESCIIEKQNKETAVRKKLKKSTTKKNNKVSCKKVKKRH